jgi:predicted Rossmann fold flavoprotein
MLNWMCMNSDKSDTWDVVVIGGGPAGMMAAGRAAERGAKVLILEKNSRLGKKLLITGGGRCNVTNAETDTRKLLAHFKTADRFLFSAFSQWNVGETLEFFHSRGMDTKVEAEQRVFPVTDKSQSVWDVLVEYLKTGGVAVQSSSPVKGFLLKDGRIAGVKLADGGEVYARSVVLATGGTSHPETGSTGDGFAWLAETGHKVEKPSAALVPVTLKDQWISRVAGLTLPKVRISVFQNNAKQETALGKLLFTHVGLSGPTILNMSRSIGELLKYGEVVVRLDLMPDLDHGSLDLKLQNIFKEQDKKMFKNSLSVLLPSSLVPIVVELSLIDPDKRCNSVTREERLNLVQLMKGLDLSVKGLLDSSKAITTSGGLALEQVNFKTMSSRLFDNLYVVGDVLNIDRPSGGYSLQICWTTGFVAGNSVVVGE